MIRIAIVEDEPECAAQLESVLKQYASDKNISITVSSFLDALTFLDVYSGNYEIVLMDIDMPRLNGLQAAQRLRSIDKRVILMFVTNMAHMAARGYEVEAFDFVIKPVHPEMMRMKMDRAIRKIQQWEDQKVAISSKGTYIWVSAADVYYIEVLDHQLIYHTKSGEHTVYGSMSKARAQLEPLGFAQCHNCYLVNLRHVRSVRQNVVFLSHQELPISAPRKKAFMQSLNQYIGG